MSTSNDVAPDHASTAKGSATGRVPDVLVMAAIASIAAGAIHATAAGAHSEPRSAMLTFVLTAVVQIGWGAWALGRSGIVTAVVGASANAAALGGWVLAKTSGIRFVDGLESAESVQFADGVAAALAGVAVIGAVAAGVTRTSFTTRPQALIGAATLAAVALAVPGMVATGNHAHGDHDHGDHAQGGAQADHGDEVAFAKPYDATLPVDLGGVPGVTAEQQADAEALVEESLRTLPQFADIAYIESLGYRSIGDGLTGNEHFVKWDLIDDGRVLDPEYPESLVFDVDLDTGEKTLAAAMFMANADDTLDTVPDLGGALVQWHIHDDLCYRGEPGEWRVAAVVAPPGECPEGTSRLSDNPVPMVHVWIRPHECGPFAALEGTGAGQIPEGEERLCDHAHGA